MNSKSFIYKKGTKITLWCCTHDSQSMEEFTFVLDSDMTGDELEDAAKDFFWQTKEPEWGFKEVAEDEE